MFNLKFDTPIPSVGEVVQILSENLEDFGIPMDYDRMLEYQAYYKMRSTMYLQRIINYTRSIESPESYKDAHFLNFLQKAGVKTGLLKTDGGAISVAADSLESAIATGLYSEELCKIMKMYSEVSQAQAKISYFKGIFNEYPVCPIETFDNHRMIVVKPIVVPQNTGRVGYRNPAVMNFDKGILDIFTVPKGWVKCEADSGQVGPRIIQSHVIKDPQLKKCTNIYNDAYYGYVHFCSMLTDEQRKSGTLDITPIELTDELKEKRKKFKTFGNAVMYGSKENNLRDKDKDNFIRYIGGHPKRVMLQKEIEDRIDRGQTVFYTAFGTPIDIMSGPSAQKDLNFSAEEQFNRKVKRAINNPIQGTAADLMRYSVLQANRMLLREAPNSRILMYVHDSGKFMVAEDEFDKIKPKLQEITSYQVEDWIPIYSDYEEGIHASSVKRFIE